VQLQHVGQEVGRGFDLILHPRVCCGHGAGGRCDAGPGHGSGMAEEEEVKDMSIQQKEKRRKRLASAQDHDVAQNEMEGLRSHLFQQAIHSLLIARMTTDMLTPLLLSHCCCSRRRDERRQEEIDRSDLWHCRSVMLVGGTRSSGTRDTHTCSSSPDRNNSNRRLTTTTPLCILSHSFMSLIPFASRLPEFSS
jgi:hypothetical protein